MYDEQDVYHTNSGLSGVKFIMYNIGKTEIPESVKADSGFFYVLKSVTILFETISYICVR